jgi:hypothetical protein
MSVSRPNEITAAERDSYTAPELTRHGSLDELTDGAGNKEIEKDSSPN